MIKDIVHLFNLLLFSPQIMGKMNNPKGWDDSTRRDLWDYNSGGSGGVQQQQGHRPPPGLPKKGSEFPVSQSQVTTSSANSFNTYRTQQSNPSNSWGQGTNSNGGNLWLLLRIKNLLINLMWRLCEKRV